MPKCGVPSQGAHVLPAQGKRAAIVTSIAAAIDFSHCVPVLLVLLQDESRWEREVGRLQQAAAVDLQRIRQEANEAAEREARLLRSGGLSTCLHAAVRVAIVTKKSTLSVSICPNEGWQCFKCAHAAKGQCRACVTTGKCTCSMCRQHSTNRLCLLFML
jgi:hypothetical protein